MVASSCLRLVVRRMALRKGLAATVAVLFLAGTGLLYLLMEHAQLSLSAAARSQTLGTVRGEREEEEEVGEQRVRVTVFAREREVTEC